MKKFLLAAILLFGGGHFSRKFMRLNRASLCKLLRNLAQEMAILLHLFVLGTSRKMIMNSPCRPLKMTSRWSYATRQTQWSTPLILLREQQRLSFPLRSQAVLNFASFPSLLPIIIEDILICSICCKKNLF